MYDLNDDYYQPIKREFILENQKYDLYKLGYLCNVDYFITILAETLDLDESQIRYNQLNFFYQSKDKSYMAAQMFINDKLMNMTVTSNAIYKCKLVIHGNIIPIKQNEAKCYFIKYDNSTGEVNQHIEFDDKIIYQSDNTALY
ncbi:MAG: hypothetical protein LBN03_02080 [Bifidobacteriaceae bacterium]|jgi:hypothetical protein|nr:hypothetical protein [Bifidobacteriaceae bacterium]